MPAPRPNGEPWAAAAGGRIGGRAWPGAAYALGSLGDAGPAAEVWFSVDYGALPWTDLAHDHAEIIQGTLHLARGYA